MSIAVKSYPAERKIHTGKNSLLLIQSFIGEVHLKNNENFNIKRFKQSKLSFLPTEESVSPIEVHSDL